MERINGLGSLHLVEHRLHGSKSLLVAAVLIHGKFIKVTEFALCGALFILFLGQGSQDAVDLFVDILLQHIKTAIAAVGGRQRMEFLPSACGITIEIIGRTHTLVKVRHVEPRLALRQHALRGRSDEHQHRENLFHVHHCFILKLEIYKDDRDYRSYRGYRDYRDHRCHRSYRDHSGQRLLAQLFHLFREFHPSVIFLVKSFLCGGILVDQLHVGSVFGIQEQRVEFLEACFHLGDLSL